MVRLAFASYRVRMHLIGMYCPSSQCSANCEAFSDRTSVCAQYVLYTTCSVHCVIAKLTVLLIFGF